MQPAISITVEPVLAKDIKDVCIEVQQLARTLGIQVRCKANDVTLMASPRGTWQVLLAQFYKATEKPAHHFKVAHSVWAQEG